MNKNVKISCIIVIFHRLLSFYSLYSPNLKVFNLSDVFCAFFILLYTFSMIIKLVNDYGLIYWFNR